MVKRRGDLAPSSLDIAIDSLGVKVSLRPSKSSKDDMDSGAQNHEVESAQQNNAAVGIGKAIMEKDKPRRNVKGTEKSVLDDIMGDPNDFGDLGDLDAGSDSNDGGRWEDTLKHNMGESDDASAAVLEETIDAQAVGDVSPNGTPKENGSMVDSSLTDCKQEPEISEERGYANKKSNMQPHEFNQGKPRPLSTVVSSDASAGQRKNSTRYFIIKSLSHHNIQMSIEKGIWATQVMNEPILEEAFKNSKRVILIFSVNMSGFFQGYAQMLSTVGWKRANVWSESNNGSNPWGRTFQVTWLCLHNLPFQKTVHLKNPLNDYKPVKISRDCQELTPEIGEALCSLIDSGAEAEGKLKRKMLARDSAHAKRFHRDFGNGPNEVKYLGGFPTSSQVNWPVGPMLYPPTQHPFVKPHDHFNSVGSIMPSKFTSQCEDTKASRARSTVASDKMNGKYKEKERAKGISKQTSDLAEEDLLHMVDPKQGSFNNFLCIEMTIHFSQKIVCIQNRVRYYFLFKFCIFYYVKCTQSHVMLHDYPKIFSFIQKSRFSQEAKQLAGVINSQLYLTWSPLYM